jgi:hypothetical protein
MAAVARERERDARESRDVREREHSSASLARRRAAAEACGGGSWAAGAYPGDRPPLPCPANNPYTLASLPSDSAGVAATFAALQAAASLRPDAPAPPPPPPPGFHMGAPAWSSAAPCEYAPGWGGECGELGQAGGLARWDAAPAAGFW